MRSGIERQVCASAGSPGKVFDNLRAEPGCNSARIVRIAENFPQCRCARKVVSRGEEETGNTMVQQFHVPPHCRGRNGHAASAGLDYRKSEWLGVRRLHAGPSPREQRRNLIGCKSDKTGHPPGQAQLRRALEEKGALRAVFAGYYQRRVGKLPGQPRKSL